MILLLRQAEEYATGRLEEMRDRIREVNEAFILQLEAAVLALQDFTSALTLTGVEGDAFSGQGPYDSSSDILVQDQQNGNKSAVAFANALAGQLRFPTPVVTINIDGSIAALNPYIVAVVDSMLEAEPGLG